MSPSYLNRHRRFAERLLLGVVLAAASGCVGARRRGTRSPPVINPPPGRPMSEDAGPRAGPDGRRVPAPTPAGRPRRRAAGRHRRGGLRDPPPTAGRRASACLCDNECDTGFCQEGACCTGTTCGRRAPGRALPAPRPVRQRLLRRRRLLQRRLQRQLRELQPARPHGRVCPGARRPDDPARRLPRRRPAESCGQSGFCNGQGGCAKYAPGTACGAAACSGPRTFIPGGECDGDGICVKGAPARLHPLHLRGRQPAAPAAWPTPTACPPHVCAAGSCGLRGKGQACTAGDQCQTGFCVDGVCCDERLRRPVPFCASPSSRGTCTPVRAGAPDPRAAAGITDPGPGLPGPGCPPPAAPTAGATAGGGCQRYENGTTCRGARCEHRPQRRDRALRLHERRLPRPRPDRLRPLPRLHRQPLHHPVWQRQPVRRRPLLHRRHLRQAPDRRAMQPGQRLC